MFFQEEMCRLKFTIQSKLSVLPFCDPHISSRYDITCMLDRKCAKVPCMFRISWRTAAAAFVEYLSNIQTTSKFLLVYLHCLLLFAVNLQVVGNFKTLLFPIPFQQKMISNTTVLSRRNPYHQIVNSERTCLWEAPGIGKG